MYIPKMTKELTQAQINACAAAAPCMQQRRHKCICYFRASYMPQNPISAMTRFANTHRSTPIYMYNAYAVRSPTLSATNVLVQCRQNDCSVKDAVPPLAITTMLQVVFTIDLWLGCCILGPGSLCGKTLLAVPGLPCNLLAACSAETNLLAACMHHSAMPEHCSSTCNGANRQQQQVFPFCPCRHWCHVMSWCMLTVSLLTDSLPAAAAIVYTFQAGPSFKAEQQVKYALLAIWLARMVFMAFK